ncbi:F-box domain containing protein [Pandoravirus neocaledonia]|uniref:F-box domain containing protein n=1 Tax=Pandoravirus neocaledonia TaxID=2107708 RepID=A0A2U7UDS8_9VIRU|nr:F-box domain containing protein [Pandoravirus neocaledonia]AVK76629.1 F-box domain containing protein [Pandoravirus neocaledonia]
MATTGRDRQRALLTWVDLPDEMWTVVLSFATCRDVCAVSAACARLCGCARDNALWMILCMRDFSRVHSPHDLQSATSVMALYRQTRERCTFVCPPAVPATKGGVFSSR